MKAVFSFWATKEDGLMNATNWTNPKFHLYSWVLAVNQAAKWFDEVELVTDSISLPLFKKLNLPFTSIRTDLDELKDYSKELWALGKIKAYQIQDKPFIHLDSDFICYKKPPEWFLSAPLGFQNRETKEWFENGYGKQLLNINKNGSDLSNTSWGTVREAFNFGIYLCNDLEYNKQYCKEVFDFIDNNKKVIYKSGNIPSYCFVFEQHIGANVAYDRGITPAFLSEFCDTDEIQALGQIHLMLAKRDVNYYEKVKKIMKNNFIEYYNLIETLI